MMHLFEGSRSDLAKGCMHMHGSHPRLCTVHRRAKRWSDRARLQRIHGSASLLRTGKNAPCRPVSTGLTVARSMAGMGQHILPPLHLLLFVTSLLLPTARPQLSEQQSGDILRRLLRGGACSPFSSSCHKLIRTQLMRKAGTGKALMMVLVKLCVWLCSGGPCSGVCAWACTHQHHRLQPFAASRQDTPQDP